MNQLNYRGQIMRKFIICNLLLFFLAFGAYAKTIKIGVEGAYPPFSKTEADGSVVGFDIDIANALCKVLRAECVLVTQDWDGMIPALLSRKFDAIIASMSITDERKKRVAFTDKYYSSPARFVKRVDDDIRILNFRMLNLKVGVQQETIMDRFVTDNWNNIVVVKRYTTQEDANNDLLVERLDLVFSELGPGSDFISVNKGKVEFVGPSYSDRKWFGDGIGIAVRKGESLKNGLNYAIRKIRLDGTYDKIAAKYFDYDIYGAEE